MAYTLAEKLLGSHADCTVKAGEVIVARVDFAMIHDARAANALSQLERLGVKSLPHVARTALVLDHYSPPPNLEAANTHWVAEVGVGLLGTSTQVRPSQAISTARAMARTAWSYGSRLAFYDEDAGCIAEMPRDDHGHLAPAPA